MKECGLGVSGLVGESKGSGQRGNGEAKLEEGVAVRGEEVLGDGGGVVRGASGLGVVVVWCARGARCRRCGDRSGLEVEIAIRGGEDAVVVDGGYIGPGAGGGGGLAKECRWAEKDRCGA